MIDCENKKEQRHRCSERDYREIKHGEWYRSQSSIIGRGIETKRERVERTTGERGKRERGETIDLGSDYGTHGSCPFEGCPLRGRYFR